MKSVHIIIDHGYGIEKFDESFLFEATHNSPHKDTHIIYAQNGTMKSSLARTLRDYTQPNIIIRDHIFGLIGKCTITDENGHDLPPENILSIPSFENTNGYRCSNMSSLVADASLKEEYDALMEAYNVALKALVKKLKAVSGAKQTTSPLDIINLVCSSFKGAPVSEASFVNLTRSHRVEIDKKPDYIQKLPYSVVGEPYVQVFAETNKDFLQEFVKRLDQVLATSSYLRGEFGTGNAQLVADALDKQKFFEADHSVVLVDKSDPSAPINVPVENAARLKELFDTDFDRVFADSPKLKTKFKKVLSKIDQVNHKDLRNILTDKETRQIITLMALPEIFKRNLWLGYLKGCATEIDELLKIQDEIKDSVADIVQRAKQQRTAWDETVQTFKERFIDLPFEIEIENKSSIILDGVSEPQLCYYYTHRTLPRKRIETDEELTPSLSTGERKAFYLLNLIFEIKIKSRSPDDCLVVLDDVVDSFDYKNKYAFMEYIYEISRDYTNIKFIVLTHNFDFFRLMQFRLFGENTKRTNSWFAFKDNAQTRLETAGQFNVFRGAREKAARHKNAWLALIPFARNLIEYQVDDKLNDPDYMVLTRCLHTIDTSPSVADIRAILKKYVGVEACPLSDSELVRDIYCSVADDIVAAPDPPLMDIHNKIVLAIASRLTCEIFLRSKLSPADVRAAEAATAPLIRALGERYTASTLATQQGKSTLDRINLITPENIHINAFMYEPLIDTGQIELERLYTSTKGLA